MRLGPRNEVARNSMSTCSPERILMMLSSAIGCNLDGNRSDATRVTSIFQDCVVSLSHRSLTEASYRAGFNPGCTCPV